MRSMSSYTLQTEHAHPQLRCQSLQSGRKAVRTVSSSAELLGQRVQQMRRASARIDTLRAHLAGVCAVASMLGAWLSLQRPRQALPHSSEHASTNKDVTAAGNMDTCRSPGDSSVQLCGLSNHGTGSGGACMARKQRLRSPVIGWHSGLAPLEAGNARS